VIWDSSHWKQPLIAMARRLKSAGRVSELSDRHVVQAERDVFLGCFSVRKLLHSGPKLTDSCRETRVCLTRYPNIAPVNSRNWHLIDELYDLADGSSENRDLEFLCNRIIHSFVFLPEAGALGELAGFFFSSDRDRNSRLYRIALNELVRVFETVGRDSPVEFRGTRGADGEWKYELK
jgi:hypothetical protein